MCDSTDPALADLLASRLPRPSGHVAGGRLVSCRLPPTEDREEVGSRR
jgi:hypothetical protein